MISPMTLLNEMQSSSRICKIFSTSFSLTLAHDSPGSKLAFSLSSSLSSTATSSSTPFLLVSLFLAVFPVVLCLLLHLLHLGFPLHQHCRLLLLVLVVVIAVHLSTLHPFLLIASWSTYLPSCFRIPPNLSSHCPKRSRG